MDPEQLKDQLMDGRTKLNSRWSHRPALSTLEFLGAPYVEEDLVAAVNGINDAFDTFFRLYAIAQAREARDNAQKVVQSKTQLIADLEAM